MKRFTDAGRQAFKQGNVYAGLSVALMLPDICAALETPGDGPTKRYLRWCRQWVQPKFMGGTNSDGTPFIRVRAENIYQLRCSLFHEGTTEIAVDKRTGVDRFLVFDDTANAHLTTFNNCVLNGELMSFVQLKGSLFSEEIFKSVDEWDVAMANDQKIQNEKAKLLIIHSAGATYGPVRFG